MVVSKGAATKEDFKNFKEEIVQQFHIISEDVISQVKQVAEGVANVNEKLDRFREERKGDLGNGLGTLAQAITNTNDKLDRTRQELKAEIQETRQEILAAVKFSYAELDKRITTLEKDFLDLKHRVERIESRSIP